MKKIFAIALALVMVLSMASAFASYCMGSFDWTCAVDENNCGKATVEVIPYVKTNAACNGSEFVESDCAAAIKGENVYYAIKLTVAEDVDAEWYAKAKVDVDVNGMTGADRDKKNFSVPKLGKDDSEDGWVYYLVWNKTAGKWGWSTEVTEDDDFEIDDVMNKSVVKEYAKAKVCATLHSDKKVEKGVLAGTVGNYWVEYVEATDAVPAQEATKATMTYVFDEELFAKIGAGDYRSHWTIVKETHEGGKVTVILEAALEGKLSDEVMADLAADDVWGVLPAAVENGKDEKAAVEGNVNALVVYTKDPAKGGEPLVTYIIEDGKIVLINYTKVCGAAEYATIKAFFGLEIGTCITDKLIAANFGWDDEVKSCYAWKTQNAVAIVDTECVVAIPKTGDASVLAWLF